MASEFYDHTTYPSQGAAGSSAALRSELDLIETGFNKILGGLLSANAGNLLVVNAGGTAIDGAAATGTGDIVRSISPTLTTPTLGVATATSVNKITWTAPASGATVTIANGKTFTVSNTLTLTATDGSTLAIGAGGTLGTAAYTAATAYIAAVTPGAAGNVLTSNGSAWTSATPATASLDDRAITTTDTVGVADIGNLVSATSGTFTLAFSAAATLGDKSFGWVRNSGTGSVTLDPNGAETIDGRTNYIMYPGEIRKWYVEGSTIKTVVEKSFSYTITATGTFIPPPGYAYYEGEMWNGGNSGEFNNLGGTSISGGGSACLPFAIPASALNTAGETVTIGAGGTAKVANSVGAVGGATSIGTVLVMPVAASAAVGSAIATEATAFYSGAAGTSGVGNGSTFGAASGGGYNGSAPQVGGTSKLAGNGGAASATTATAGVAPGGGGGAAGSAGAVASGAGARGEVRIRGSM